MITPLLRQSSIVERKDNGFYHHKASIHADFITKCRSQRRYLGEGMKKIA
jgi:hypothetical protein